MYSLFHGREGEREVEDKVGSLFHFQQFFEGVCANDTNERGCQMCHK